MKENRSTLKWMDRLDSICVFVAALVPFGIIIGNAGFEGTISLVGVCWLIRTGLARQNPFPGILTHPLVLPWVVWYVSILASLFWNGAGSKGWTHDIVFIRHLLFFMAMLDVSQRRRLVRPLLIGLAIGVGWAALNTTLAHVLGHDLIGKSVTRYTGKIKEAERIASFTAYTAPFFFSWLILDRRLANRQRLGLIAGVAVSLALLAVIGIRTAQLGAIAGFLAAAACLLINFLTRKTAMVLFLVMGLGLGVGIKHVPLGSMDSMLDRVNIWKVAWAVWKEHPVLGVSASAWTDAYREMESSGKVAPYAAPDGRVVRSPEAMHAHSLFFQLISAGGLVGFASFGWLFVSAARHALKRPERWRYGLVPWPVVFLVIGLTGWNIFGAQYLPIFAYFMVLTGLREEPDR